MRIKGKQIDNPLSGLSFNLQELSGGLADIGVMVPIVAALILNNGFNPTAVLLVFALTYIGAGLYYRLPIPVQPLKAMAAIAIAQGLSPEVVSAAGLIMGVVLLTLGVTGAIGPIAKLFPRPIVRGIQVAVGLLLVRAGFELWSGPQVVRDGSDVFVSLAGLAVPAGTIIAVLLGGILLFTLWQRKLPATLLVLVPALVIGVFAGSLATMGGLALGPDLPQVSLPDGGLLATALVVLVIPQLPLTLGNAVIACTDTAHSYFGREAQRVNHRSLLLTTGTANLLVGSIGGMPVCHGSGGLTAHYRFGARTGGATIMLGAVLLVLALVFGASAVQLFGLIPLPALGVLLTAVGVQHALFARDTRPGLEWMVVGLIAAVSLITSNLAIGFGSGIVLYQVATQGRRVMSHALGWGQRRLGSSPAPHPPSGATGYGRRTN
ncbi:MAG: putative sulfate/molybdate transporter [Dehalococcoidia bacterium]